MNWLELIKQLRNKMLITQSELAEEIGVTFATVNRYENGWFEPTMKIKRKLMRLFKIYGIVESDTNYGK
ncbi:DNA-binding XRE family transcriptional regulator [Metamycoplasma subdolum]|uniref:DNA-binding XRE family transcriptional regulator n=1 Tax=Metamycoplasma subdolum TaxID=92407 RepID=A0A3M0A288_9BACT|nr:helix-turn-helix transcriptional regulator [Metamycoplasma subdolum]RMA77579.1 DNA-binding XRE family transcriptional regulator [Metamycoplasma subdolum]WPB50373.1 helix-turn-helix transcriptional regulator [Metamycoplasma subdolum]